jgi:hypothetical protein
VPHRRPARKSYGLQRFRDFDQGFWHSAKDYRTRRAIIDANLT